MAADDYRCPHCDTTIRATGGGSALYETDRERNKVVPHDLQVFDKAASVDNRIDYLHYCPNQDCPVWRLFPLDWDGQDDND